MAKKNRSQWTLGMAGFTAFILATIFYLITGPNVPAILGFLTAAIIMIILNAIYVFYTNKKSGKQKSQV